MKWLFGGTVPPNDAIHKKISHDNCARYGVKYATQFYFHTAERVKWHFCIFWKKTSKKIRLVFWSVHEVDRVIQSKQEGSWSA